MSINSNLFYLKFAKFSGINYFLQNIPKKRHQNEEYIEKNKIYKNINEINNLSELKIFIQKSNTCALKNHANKTVFSDGNSNSKIMLIGEAPGFEEDKTGKPFVGLAGKLLDKMLHSINLDRNSVYITNIVPWRPPNNRTPSTDEIIQCLPFVQKHIEIIKPNLLILLGSTAVKGILTSSEGITKLRGRWHEYKSYNMSKSIVTRAIFHPAFLLRSPSNKRETWNDLKEIENKIKELTK